MAPNAKILFTKIVFILTPFAVVVVVVAAVFVVGVAAFQAVVDVAAALLAIVYS